jgi:membrane fusion protein (multidrug efflux system)
MRDRFPAKWLPRAAALLAVACAEGGANGPSRQKARKAPLVEVEPVRRADVDVERSFLVTLLAAEEVGVVSRASGYVLSWHADRGDRVRKGQRLASIEREELSAAQHEARARLASARASLDNARANAVRVEALVRDGLVSAQDADASRTSLRVAEAAVSAAEASLKSDAARSGYADVAAPFDGYVFERLVDVGSLVGPSGPALFKVGSIRRVKAVVTVPQADALRIAVGQPVGLSLDGLPGRAFPGRVTRFPPSLDPSTRTVAVEVEFDNADEVLRPGMFGRTAVVVERLRDALVVPPRAVARRDVQGAAYVVRDGKAVRVQLGLGRTLPDGRVEVLSGLAEGDVLVVAGRDLLRDGVDVRTTAPAAPAPEAPGPKAVP